MPKRKNTFSSWRHGLAQRAVHAAWAWVQRTGSVTAEHPGRLRFGAIGEATRLAFPLGTVFGEPWIRLGSHCIIAEQVTLTAGLMPDLDLGGPDPERRRRRGARPRQPCHRGHHGDHRPRLLLRAVRLRHLHQPLLRRSARAHRRQWPRMEPVEIGPGCWIGTGAVILPGARIGRNVVVAAGAVVRGTVPDHAVVAALPPRSYGVGRRGRLAAAAADPGTGADPGRDDAGAAARAGRAGRVRGGPARRAGDRGAEPLSRWPAARCRPGRGPRRPPGRHAAVR
ncbi:hypothetical protein GPN2_13041 [Streptomyces murinus]